MSNKKPERKVDTLAQKQGSAAQKLKDARKQKQSQLSKLNEAMNW